MQLKVFKENPEARAPGLALEVRPAGLFWHVMRGLGCRVGWLACWMAGSSESWCADVQ